jgi:predicted nuclease of predicted toxin-antitoxin system
LKLLFDQNLAPRLVADLADIYPNSKHVRDFGLERADDTLVWGTAAKEGLAVVTKDDDFRQRSFMFGAPPKVVWVRMGNCKTSEVEALLRERCQDLLNFESDPAAALLMLSRLKS